MVKSVSLSFREKHFKYYAIKHYTDIIPRLCAWWTNFIIHWLLILCYHFNVSISFIETVHYHYIFIVLNLSWPAALTTWMQTHTYYTMLLLLLLFFKCIVCKGGILENIKRWSTNKAQKPPAEPQATPDHKPKGATTTLEHLAMCPRTTKYNTQEAKEELPPTFYDPVLQIPSFSKPQTTHTHTHPCQITHKLDVLNINDNNAKAFAHLRV